jgi:hypothetical protein
MNEPIARDELARRTDYLINRTLRHIIPSALTDEPIRQVDCHDWWDDEFLTNVVVPYLEHLRNHSESELKELLLQGEDKNRDSSAFTFAVDHSKDLSALERVIHICNEWRG